MAPSYKPSKTLGAGEGGDVVDRLVATQSAGLPKTRGYKMAGATEGANQPNP